MNDMRYFLDTEFVEDGHTIDLISIGIVAEDGREFYAESSECDLDRASPWVKENVLPHLRGKSDCRAAISAALMKFVGDDKPEFWADYASYDWVALCQLFGTMLDLPEGWPMFCMDVQQLRWMQRYPYEKIPVPESARPHDALSDAWECKAKYEWLWEHRD